MPILFFFPCLLCDPLVFIDVFCYNFFIEIQVYEKLQFLNIPILLFILVHTVIVYNTCILTSIWKDIENEIDHAF